MNWLRLHVSNVCNFKCPNCHVFEMTENIHASQLMKEEIFVHSIKEVSDHLLKNNHHQLTISLYGGETFANKKVIFNVLKNQKELFNQNIKLHWIINTNGSLMTEEDAIFLKQHNVEIHISIDGNKTTHNLSRRYHSGKPTYLNVIKALELIQKYQIKSQLNSYLMPTNIDSLKDIVDIAEQFCINQIYLDQLYSENMSYGSSILEKYQDIYLYSLSKNITLTGPWSRVHHNLVKFQSRNTEFLNELSIDINVDGSFYSSTLPKLKYSPIPQQKLASFLADEYVALKKSQMERYISECSHCRLKDQCMGLAKEQVWYHINQKAETSASCHFFNDWIDYLSRPIYFYQENNFNIFSLFPKEDIETLINEIRSTVNELEIKLWKLKEKFTIRIVENAIELRYASKQYSLPNWAKSTTDKKTLYHLSSKPTSGLKHEIVHLFLNQKEHNLPLWAIEGICEWFQSPVVNLKNLPKSSLQELSDSFYNPDKLKAPIEDHYYQTAKNFFCYIELLQGNERMCQTLVSMSKLDLNQWLFELNLSNIEDTYRDYQQFVW